MTSPRFDTLQVGDLVWLSKFGDGSPIWLVTRVEVWDIPGTIELTDLENCHVQVLLRLSLNTGMAIL
jgi:hypothetical protein